MSNGKYVWTAAADGPSRGHGARIIHHCHDVCMCVFACGTLLSYIYICVFIYMCILYVYKIHCVCGPKSVGVIMSCSSSEYG